MCVHRGFICTTSLCCFCYSSRTDAGLAMDGTSALFGHGTRYYHRESNQGGRRLSDDEVSWTARRSIWQLSSG